jgi:hypothetical protein
LLDAHPTAVVTALVYCPPQPVSALAHTSPTEVCELPSRAPVSKIVALDTTAPWSHSGCDACRENSCPGETPDLKVVVIAAPD